MAGYELGLPQSSHFFDDILDPLGWPLMSAGTFRPLATKPSARSVPIDFLESENEYQIKADIPGVNKNEIQLDCEGDTLMISVKHDTKKEDKKEEDTVKWHRVERSSFFVKRSLRMPENADVANASAAYDAGVLKVTVPKVEVEQQNRKHISIA